jgi:large subunit ribosomal protein L15
VTSPKLSPPEGSKKTNKRLGRGRGSGLGKTSGRGHKGSGARAGSKRRAWFEGGQMPLQRRLPKGGFKPLSRTTYQVVNLSTLAKAESGSTLTPLEMAAKGWIKHSDGLVKVLGDGDFSTKLNLHAHAFSKSAEEKIRSAGGSVTRLPRFSPSAGAASTGTEN